MNQPTQIVDNKLINRIDVVLEAFAAMGATTEQLRLERDKLRTDAAYLADWYDEVKQ